MKSLSELDKAITKVIWNWETFYLKFDIQIKKKERRLYGPLGIFQAKEIGKESWDELFTNIWYDAKKEKLIFTQNTHNGTKTFEIDEFEFDKKINIHVTTSNIYVNGKWKNYINPDATHTWDRRENKLKSKNIQVKIDKPYSYAELFEVTDFKLSNQKINRYYD